MRKLSINIKGFLCDYTLHYKRDGSKTVVLTITWALGKYVDSWDPPGPTELDSAFLGFSWVKWHR